MDSIKVFICEDESIVREGLRDMIPWEKYGFEFVGDAPDGEMALPMIRKLKPDVLITDITMPFMDGLSLSRIVMSELPNTKIMIISGYSDFEYARKAIELGVEQHVVGIGMTGYLAHRVSREEHIDGQHFAAFNGFGVVNGGEQINLVHQFLILEVLNGLCRLFLADKRNKAINSSHDFLSCFIIVDN